MASSIQLRGARTHNLKGVDLDLALGTMTVICGVSGSGKSSLALDTLHVEGRRRLAQTLSVKLRALLDQQPRPELDSLVGVPPTLAVTQNRGDDPGPRATVGTLSELQQLLGVLFTRLGTQHDPATGAQVETHRADQILQELLALPEGTRLTLLAPAREAATGDQNLLMEGLLAEGFARVRVNGVLHRIEDLPPLDPKQTHRIQVVVDRIRISPEREARLADALRTALMAGQGRVVALLEDGEHPFMEQAWVPGRDQPLPPLSPALLNFNTAGGACPSCQGLGEIDAQICSNCQGQRLSPESLALRLNGHSPGALMEWPLSQLGPWLMGLGIGLPGLAEELGRRLDFLERVGLGYLHLNRSANSLSRGELQRLRLASLVTTPLQGV
ncbi:MAG: excinuclease ABC subunit A, partial [Cognaticolwellia sp.]